MRGAETQRDCVSGATFVKRFRNFLEVAGSVGCCAPTDPERFLALRLVVAKLKQRRTRDRFPFWHSVQSYGQYPSVLVVGHYTRERSGPIFDSDCISAIACCSKSDVSRFQYKRGPLILDLHALVVSVDDKMTN